MKSSANWISKSRCWARRCAAGGLCAAALASAPLHAHPPPPFDQGLLWRISRTGVQDSFVFGTIHIPDPRVVIAKPVGEALARSRMLALELGSGVANEEVFELEQFRDGRRLQPLIGDEAFKQVRVELIAQDVPEGVIERMKPWAAMIKVSRGKPRGGGEASLDQQLLATARARGMRIEPLEWVEEQIASFDAVPLESQVALLKHALAHRAALESAVDASIDAWLRGDLARLARVSDRMGEQYADMRPHYWELTRHIIQNRTILMHHRLIVPLRGGRVFVAVGALHLYGDKGLLAMIARDRYRVTRVF